MGTAMRRGRAEAKSLLDHKAKSSIVGEGDPELLMEKEENAALPGEDLKLEMDKEKNEEGDGISSSRKKYARRGRPCKNNAKSGYSLRRNNSYRKNKASSKTTVVTRGTTTRGKKNRRSELKKEENRVAHTALQIGYEDRVVCSGDDCKDTDDNGGGNRKKDDDDDDKNAEKYTSDYRNKKKDDNVHMGNVGGTSYRKRRKSANPKSSISII